MHRHFRGCIGDFPAERLGLVKRLMHVAGPGRYWENANLDAVVSMVRAMDEIHFKAGDVLWQAGELSPHFWDLVCGTVVCTNPAGQQVEVGAGFGLGFYDALADVPRSFDAVATHDGVALRSTVNEMLAVLQHHSDMAMDLLAGVASDFARALASDRVRQARAFDSTPASAEH